jgi:hypothetical protein
MLPRVVRVGVGDADQRRGTRVVALPAGRLRCQCDLQGIIRERIELRKRGDETLTVRSASSPWKTEVGGRRIVLVVR